MKISNNKTYNRIWEIRNSEGLNEVYRRPKDSWHTVRECVRAKQGCPYPWHKVCPRLSYVLNGGCAWPVSLPDRDWSRYVSQQGWGR